MTENVSKRHGPRTPGSDPSTRLSGLRWVRLALVGLVLLAENPRPDGVVKLKGADNEYRIRIGDYRGRYEVGDEELIILLLQCKHRKDVYKS